MIIKIQSLLYIIRPMPSGQAAVPGRILLLLVTSDGCHWFLIQDRIDPAVGVVIGHSVFKCIFEERESTKADDHFIFGSPLI